MPPCAPRGRRAQPHRVTAGAGCRQGPGPASLPGGVTGGHRARHGQGQGQTPPPPPPPAGPIRPGNGPSQEVPAAVRSTAPAPPPAAGPGLDSPPRRVPSRLGLSRPVPLRPDPGCRVPECPVPERSERPPPHSAAGGGAGARWHGSAAHCTLGAVVPRRERRGALGRRGLQVPA